MRLTDIAIRALPAPPKGAKVHHCDTLTGFGVRVTSTGVKSFVLTYGADRERCTLGRYPIISLAEARQTAKELLAERTLGKHRPARLRASDALARFLTEREAKNKASTLKITQGLIRNHFPKLLGKNLEDVQTDDVTSVTDKLLKKEQPGAAAHAFTAIRTFLRWCVKRRYLQHSPIEGLDKPGQSTSRERVLSDGELRIVWKVAQSTPSPFGDIVRLLILTGQRRSEIGALKTEYCKFDPRPDTPGGHATQDESNHSDSQVQSTICLPSDITKNKRRHTLPVGTTATFILNSAFASAHQDDTTFLFPARGKTSSPFNGWSKAKAQLDQKVVGCLREASKEIMPWTLHDLRRTYATNLQRLDVRLEVIEALLRGGRVSLNSVSPSISGTSAG